jgi:hypothetical protein
MYVKGAKGGTKGLVLVLVMAAMGFVWVVVGGVLKRSKDGGVLVLVTVLVLVVLVEMVLFLVGVIVVSALVVYVMVVVISV